MVKLSKGVKIWTRVSFTREYRDRDSYTLSQDGRFQRNMEFERDILSAQWLDKTGARPVQRGL
jgi:hypothetical protein